MTYETAWKLDQGADVRTDISVGEGVCDGDVVRGAGPRDADVRRDGRDQGTAAVADAGADAHDADL